MEAAQQPPAKTFEEVNHDRFIQQRENLKRIPWSDWNLDVLEAYIRLAKRDAPSVVTTPRPDDSAKLDQFIAAKRIC